MTTNPSFSAETVLYARQALSILLDEHNCAARLDRITAELITDRDGPHLYVVWRDTGEQSMAEARFYPDAHGGGRMNLYRLVRPGRQPDLIPLEDVDVFTGTGEHGLPRLALHVSKLPFQPAKEEDCDVRS